MSETIANSGARNPVERFAAEFLDRQRRGEEPSHTATVWGVPLGPDGTRLASGSLDQTVGRCDGVTAQERRAAACLRF
jgi:WD40 repeat protein